MAIAIQIFTWKLEAVETSKPKVGKACLHIFGGSYLVAIFELYNSAHHSE